jgi:methionine synthase I (cobalamin-dependent)
VLEETPHRTDLLERLRAGEVLVGDGAWGTLILAHGLRPGEPPDAINLSRPEVLDEIGRQYLEAGAALICVETMTDLTEAILAVRAARAAAPGASRDDHDDVRSDTARLLHCHGRVGRTSRTRIERGRRRHPRLELRERKQAHGRDR